MGITDLLDRLKEDIREKREREARIKKAEMNAYYEEEEKERIKCARKKARDDVKRKSEHSFFNLSPQNGKKKKKKLSLGIELGTGGMKPGNKLKDDLFFGGLR